MLGAVLGWLFAQRAFDRSRTKTEYRFVEMPESAEGIIARPFPKVIDNHNADLVTMTVYVSDKPELRDRLEALGYTQFKQ